jgi:DNA-binding winged helix-turn-helix (wHTH) protein
VARWITFLAARRRIACWAERRGCGDRTEVHVLVAIFGGQSKDEEHLARIAASGGHQLEFYRASPPEREWGCAQGASEPLLEAGVGPRALVFEAADRADLALGALRAVRRDPYFDAVGALIALNAQPAGYAELPGDFDDFVFHPYTREELQIRLRALERRRPAEGAGQPRTRAQLEGIEVEEVSRTLYVDGRSIQLTAREFALFQYLCEWRGQVLSRERLLSRVWGSHYSGGRRTVDIHVRRLRAKLGDALPLETVRGAGYRLRGFASERSLNAEFGSATGSLGPATSAGEDSATRH